MVPSVKTTLQSKRARRYDNIILVIKRSFAGGYMIKKLRNQINEYFVGKEEVVDNLLICLLSGGHVLLEDVPGVGKTTLARVLSASAGADFGRIQFTPDTLPGDVTGMSVYNMKTGDFEYRQGAVMHNFLLADEINRTSPKTQSSLLEAMAEGQVTVDGREYRLLDPFMVIATQNPIEYLGTYPLPEAQLDRFMMKLSIGYPQKESEIALTRNALCSKSFDDIPPVCSASDIISMKQEVEQIHLSDKLLEYIQEISTLTRKEESFVTGVSPRATIYLAKAARAKAYMDERDFVKPDDVKAVCVNTFHHRLVLTPQARIKNGNTDSIIKALILKARIPME